MKKDEEDIINYLENNLSTDERVEFERQMDESSDFRKEVDDFAFIWRTSGELKLHNKVSAARNWVEVSERIKKDKQKTLFFKYARTAAAILLLPLLIFSGVLFYHLKDLTNKPIQQIEVKVATGLVSKVALPDGSEVWINSGSALTYPQVFRGERRVVYLSGEAYFKVESDKSNPFDVILDDGLVVSAYGTEFNIDAYTEEKDIKVTLVTGHVDVKSIAGDISLKLKKGEQFLYNKTNKTGRVSDANLSVETAWKDRRIVFRRTAMEDVVKRLSRHFNADIRLDGKELFDYEYSATFGDETLSEILDLLSRTAPIEYKIVDPTSPNDTISRRSVVLSMKK